MHYVVLGVIGGYGSPNCTGSRRFTYWAGFTPFSVMISGVPFFVALHVYKIILELHLGT